MAWPMSHEFNEAIQNTNVVFSDPDLRTGEAVVGARGLPLPRSGNFADVYQVRGADGRDWAVKCFTRPVTGLGERYAVISEALAQASLPFTVNFTYLAEGIRIGAKWWPVVKMEWVEGLLLNQVVREHAGKPAVLGVLGVLWVRLCKRLRESRVAHADLQHGNVLLVPGSRPGAYGLKLIDYDGIYVPALANHPSGESGHPAYQHPARTSKGGYSPDVDRFPELLIATALKGLEVGGVALWERYDTGDNLLFTEEDVKNPAGSKLMRELWNTNHPGVQSLVGRLAIASLKPMPQTPWLDQIAPDGDPILLDDQQRRDALQALGLTAAVAVPQAVAVPVPAPLPLDPQPAPAVWEAIAGNSPAPIASVPTRSGATRSPVAAASTSDRSRNSGASKRPARTAPEKDENEDAPRSSSGRMLAIAGGVVLLVGGTVAGVVMFSGKSNPPGGTDGDQAGAALSGAVGPSKDKDSSSKSNSKKGGESSGKSAKAKGDDALVIIEPTEPKQDPVAGPGSREGGATSREPAAKLRKELSKADLDFLKPRDPPMLKEVVELKPRWTGPAALPAVTRFFADPENNLLVLGSSEGSLALDLRTGAPRKEKEFVALGNMKTHELYPLEHDKFGTLSPKRDDFDVFEAKTGALAERITAPTLPAGPAVAANLYTELARNKKYVAVGRIGAPGVDLPSVPLKILDAGSRKAIVTTEWHGGVVRFTADCSRVLVAEWTGAGRWYKLPSGEKQEESGWDFGSPQSGRVSVVHAISGDGSLAAYSGPPAAKAEASVMGLLDGKTGRVVRTLPADYLDGSGIALSENGRRIAAFRSIQPGRDVREIDVISVATGLVVCRARLEPGKAVPTFDFTPDGKSLLVYDPNGRLVYVFDLADS